MATDVIQIKYEADMAQLQAQLKGLQQENAKLIKQEKDFGTAATKAGNDAAGATAKAGAETDKLNTKTKQVEGSFSQLGKTIGAAFALDRIRAFITESVKAAAAAEGIEAAFNRIAPEGTLEKLRIATKNTVSDVQLMTAAVKANNFQLPLQNLPKFFEFAQKRARETGESVDYLVESIVLGIGRKSPLILDNLGISAVRLREKFRGISDEQVDVAAVSQAVEDIVTEELDKMGASATTTADKIAQWGAAFDNAKVKAGEFFIIFGTFIEEYITNFSWKDVFDPLGLMFGEAREKAEQAITNLKLAKEQQQGFNDAYHDAREQLKKLSEEEVKRFAQNARYAEFERGRYEGVKKAVVDEIKARKAARDSEKQYNTASIKELENWIAFGDAGAQKELTRRKKADAEAAKARDAAIKADQQALSDRLKESEKYYDELENLEKEKFLSGELTEEELSKSLVNIDRQRLAAQIQVHQDYKAKTVEVQKQVEDAVYNLQNQNLDEWVKAKKEADAELEKSEKDRLSRNLKDHEEYWQMVNNANVQLLKDGVITQEQYDKITEENQQKILKTRLALYKDFEGKTEAVNEEVNKGIAADQEKLNNLIVDGNKKKNDQLEKDNEESAKKRKEIEQELQSQVQDLVSNFISFRLKTTQAETDNKLENLDREEAAIDQKLDNEIIGEQQAEAAKQDIANKRRQLKNEQAQRDKQAAIAQAVIDGIANVIKVLANPVLAGIVAGANLLQLGLLIGAPVPQYRKGKVRIKGPGTDTSDSILARISNNESVINAESTRAYEQELEAINKNDGSFKKIIRDRYVLPALHSYINDNDRESESDRIEKVVKQVLVNAKFNDSRIVENLKRIKPATSADINKLGDRMDRKSRVDAFKNRHK